MLKSVFVQRTNDCYRRGLDAARVADYFRLNGYAIAKHPLLASVIVCFTCGFKKEEGDEGFAEIKRLKRYGKRLIVLGCLPAIALKELKEVFNGEYLPTFRLEEIDKLFPEFKIKFRDVADANMEVAIPKDRREASPSKQGVLQRMRDFFKGFEFSAGFLKSRYWTVRKGIRNPFFEGTTARIPKGQMPTLRVARGCMGKCSYCVIRSAIGPLKSKPIEECVKEYKALLDAGHTYFRIGAEDTGSYGLDIGSSLPELLDALSKADEGKGTKWLLHSISPNYLIKYRKPLLDLVKKGKISTLKCDFQSGSDRIVKLMQRNYKVKDFVRVYNELKNTNPGWHGYSQVMVGFPSETEAEFEKTLKVMEELGLNFYTVFKYCDMPGCSASKLPGKISEKEKTRRQVKIKEYFEENGYSSEWYKGAIHLTRMVSKDVLNKIISAIGAKTYLEIGIKRGETFSAIKCKRKLGIEPMPYLPKNKPSLLDRNIKYFKMTSDEFFSKRAEKIFSNKKIDVAFIDGLHEYRQALRDVQNCLKYLDDDGVIVMHDCNPWSETVAIPAKSQDEARKKAQNKKQLYWNGDWAGDVWKSIVWLRSLEKGVNAFVLDCDTGLGIVTKGKPKQTLGYSQKEIEKMQYADLAKNRKKLLGLKDANYLKSFLKKLSQV